MKKQIIFAHLAAMLFADAIFSQSCNSTTAEQAANANSAAPASNADFTIASP